MGERAAYRVKQGDEYSPMMRKQWYVGSSHQELTNLITKVASMLASSRFSRRGDVVSEIGAGGGALRDDLGWNRLAAALFDVLYDPPFDEIVSAGDIHCDINDHGIYEIEMIEWDIWEINQYDVDWNSDTESNSLGLMTHIATVTFQNGKTLEEGMGIDFHVSDDWEYPNED